MFASYLGRCCLSQANKREQIGRFTRSVKIFRTAATRARVEKSRFLSSKLESSGIHIDLAGSDIPDVAILYDSDGLELWKPRRTLDGAAIHSPKKKGKRGKRKSLSGEVVADSSFGKIRQELQNAMENDASKATIVAWKLIPEILKWDMSKIQEIPDKQPSDPGHILWNSWKWYAEMGEDAKKAENAIERALEVCIVMCSDTSIARVNTEFRGKPPGTTADVLSFPSLFQGETDELEFLSNPDELQQSSAGANSSLSLLSESESRAQLDRIMNAEEPGSSASSSNLQLTDDDDQKSAPEFIDLSSMSQEELRSKGLSDEDIIAIKEQIRQQALTGNRSIYELGSVVISVETAEAQAQSCGLRTIDELRILFVHGLLHIMGFDHKTSPELEQMYLLENRVLEALGWKGRGVCQNAYAALERL